MNAVSASSHLQLNRCARRRRAGRGAPPACSALRPRSSRHRYRSRIARRLPTLGHVSPQVISLHKHHRLWYLRAGGRPQGRSWLKALQLTRELVSGAASEDLVARARLAFEALPRELPSRFPDASPFVDTP